MLKWIDQSRLLSGLLDWFSNLLAEKRGLPILLGILLVVASMLVQSVNVFLEQPIVDLIGIIVHHAGVLIALIGVLLANPLGR